MTEAIGTDNYCNRRWAAAADAVTNGRPAVVAAGQFNRSLSA